MVFTFPEGTSEASFNAKVAQYPGKVVIVDFFATWCGPCVFIAPQLEQLENEKSDTVVVLKVDVDECEELAAAKEISAMPTFHFYKDGEKVDDMMGADIEGVKAKVEAHL